MATAMCLRMMLLLVCPGLANKGNNAGGSTVTPIGKYVTGGANVMGLT
jgi:hypothetical protein